MLKFNRIPLMPLIQGLVLALLVTACQSPAPTVEKPTVLPSPIPADAFSRTPTRAFSVAQVQSVITTSSNLDRVHRDKGVACEGCHQPYPPNHTPEISVCLSCHAGTYTELASLTARLKPNPHASHPGEIPCYWCHRVHSPFEYYCTSCHKDEYLYTGRFAAGTPTPGK